MKLDELCVKCKGRKALCGLVKCPVMENLSFKRTFVKSIDKHMFGPSDNVFVGEHNYPNVLLGPLVSSSTCIGDYGSLLNMDYENIVTSFSAYVRSIKSHSITSRLASEMNDIALSTRQVDVEALYSKKPTVKMGFHADLQPIGATGLLEKVKVCDNPVIPALADQLIEDRVKAVSAVDELNQKGFDNYYIMKLLSTGMLGFNKKIVPTRWAITATDDTLGKLQLKALRDFQEYPRIAVFHSNAVHNRFIVILQPGKWEFEQFEAYSPGTLWTATAEQENIVYDHEPHEGKKGYSIQAGGYYAARMAVCEYLLKVRRQARVTVIREISEGYRVPVGVWQVRENVRAAMANPVFTADSLPEAFDAIRKVLSIAPERYAGMSKIMRQRRLGDFF